MPIIKGTLCSTLYRLTAEVCFPIALCRARMSAFSRYQTRPACRSTNSLASAKVAG